MERERFPRFHIGESQFRGSTKYLTRSAHTTQSPPRDLSRSGAPVSPPPTVTPTSTRTSRRPTKSHVRRPTRCRAHVRPGPARPRRQLWRARAARAATKQAVFEPDGVTVLIAAPDGSESIRAAAVIDASGRAGFIAKLFGERQKDPVLKNISVHCQYRRIPRSEGRRAGDIRMVTRPDGGWFWFIPISDTIISVGAVVPQRSTTRTRNRRPRRPSRTSWPKPLPPPGSSRPRRRSAPPASTPTIRISTVARRGSFRPDGRRGRVPDPIFSTGVLLAMQSGTEAAEAVSAGLVAGDLRACRFAALRAAPGPSIPPLQPICRGLLRSGFSGPVLQPLFPLRHLRGSPVRVGGNWRPSMATRLRLGSFFALVALLRMTRRVAGRRLSRLRGEHGAQLMRVAAAIPAYEAAHSVGSVVIRTRSVIEDCL